MLAEPRSSLELLNYYLTLALYLGNVSVIPEEDKLVDQVQRALVTEGNCILMPYKRQNTF